MCFHRCRQTVSVNIFWTKGNRMKSLKINPKTQNSNMNACLRFSRFPLLPARRKGVAGTPLACPQLPLALGVLFEKPLQLQDKACLSGSISPGGWGFFYSLPSKVNMASKVDFIYLKQPVVFPKKQNMPPVLKVKSTVIGAPTCWGLRKYRDDTKVPTFNYHRPIPIL